MSWERIRASAKRVVHSTFAREATYLAPEAGATPVAARIRLHTKFLRYGDLESDGFAQVIDDVNQVMVDSGEIIPRQHGVIEFASGPKYRITNVIPDKDSEFWTCEVQPA